MFFMYQKTVTIVAPHGIHTRPAALLVKEAKEFDCDIMVECNGKQASAKSLFKLQTLGLYQGMSVTVLASGEHGQAAVDKIASMLITLS
ncbi:phosphocarrier, HPr family protein [Shewanella frigidimarina NCIMB 400]|jgi:phosphocarrier protein HPr|uniref:Phosphocarrier protein HPr n=2 Tax=Shewanella frigidimarina TaxID=56812 RepID=Q083E6_SHEFN|nr:phosphocarrier, HPr family protein [Shewanella frigidimarina NCIMB 400]|tara:strand:- start:2390 stop:2656 length:267 start_codon:yes stop_codon:yes gene_type:complete